MKASFPLIALLMAASPVGAAIVATSLPPPLILHNQYRPDEGYGVDIDIDGDGVRDFFTSTNGGQCSIVPTGNNRIMAFDEPPPDLGWVLAAMVGGEAIGTEPEFGVWRGLMNRVDPLDYGGAVIYKYNGRVPVGEPETYFSTIPVNVQVVSYVGVEVYSGATKHYGWIGISGFPMGTNHTVNVHGWAWETEAGQAIAAGAIPEPSAALLAMAAGTLALRRARPKCSGR